MRRSIALRCISLSGFALCEYLQKFRHVFWGWLNCYPHGSTFAKFLKNSLAFLENNRYNTTCCDMIAVKREVAAERRVFPWSECQEAGTLPGQET